MFPDNRGYTATTEYITILGALGASADRLRLQDREVATRFIDDVVSAMHTILTRTPAGLRALQRWPELYRGTTEEPTPHAGRWIEEEDR